MITDRGLRLFLKFERDSADLAAANETAETQTGIANQERGRRLQLEDEKAQERETSDERLLEIGQLRRRPKVWHVIVLAGGALIAGAVMGVAADRMLEDE